MTLFHRIPAEPVRSIESGAWFQGHSQLVLPYIVSFDEGISFSFAFKTFSSTGQLAYLTDETVSFAGHLFLLFHFMIDVVYDVFVHQ